MKILNTTQTANKLNICRTTLWKIRLNPENKFPKKVQVTEGKGGWINQELDEWLLSRDRV